ncbi:MAG: hypothetical protein HZB68_05150 [Candidatus Aenigmarchaeota archaeon]|nr:hypothetical protein [Candidatus Aenigmarchaeota archaeon]
MPDEKLKLTEDERKLVKQGAYWSHWYQEDAGRPEMLVDKLVSRMYDIHGSDAVRIDRYHKAAAGGDNEIAKDFALRYFFDFKNLPEEEGMVSVAEEDLNGNMTELDREVYDDSTGFLKGKRAYAYCADGIVGCLDFYAIFNEDGMLVSFSEHSD